MIGVCLVNPYINLYALISSIDVLLQKDESSIFISINFVKYNCYKFKFLIKL